MPIPGLLRDSSRGTSKDVARQFLIALARRQTRGRRLRCRSVARLTFQRHAMQKKWKRRSINAIMRAVGQDTVAAKNGPSERLHRLTFRHIFSTQCRYYREGISHKAVLTYSPFLSFLLGYTNSVLSRAVPSNSERDKFPRLRGKTLEPDIPGWCEQY